MHSLIFKLTIALINPDGILLFKCLADLFLDILKGFYNHSKLDFLQLKVLAWVPPVIITLFDFPVIFNEFLLIAEISTLSITFLK